MIPWWGWLVIWGCLALALTVVLAVSAIRLFQKGVGVLDELESLAAKTELLDDAVDENNRTRTELALLAGSEETRRRRTQIREAAEERRTVRHENRLERAQRIIRVDATTREWFRGR